MRSPIDMRMPAKPSHPPQGPTRGEHQARPRRQRGSHQVRLFL